MIVSANDARELIRSAYGAGWRAGMAQPVTVPQPNGTKILRDAPCPFTGWLQCLLALAWHDGFHNGRMESLRRWLAR